MEMPTPKDGMARFAGGLPGFEIVPDRPTPLRIWLLAGTAIVGTLPVYGR